MRDLAHRSSAEQHKACELASILQSLDNLLTYPWLKRRVEQGLVKLHGWYFDIEAGALMAYSARQQRFLPLVCPLVPRRDVQPGQVDKSALPWTDSEETARTA